MINCIAIPSWSIFILGIILSAIGWYIFYKTWEDDNKFITTFCGMGSGIFGLFTAVYGTIPYINTILSIIPCIVVVP